MGVNFKMLGVFLVLVVSFVLLIGTISSRGWIVGNSNGFKVNVGLRDWTTAGMEAQCWREFGIDYYGDDIDMLILNSSAACCLHSTNISGAVAWTWRNSTGECYIKSDEGGRADDPSVVSGILPAGGSGKNTGDNSGAGKHTEGLLIFVLILVIIAAIHALLRTCGKLESRVLGIIHVVVTALAIFFTFIATIVYSSQHAKATPTAFEYDLAEAGLGWAFSLTVVVGFVLFIASLPMCCCGGMGGAEGSPLVGGN